MLVITNLCIMSYLVLVFVLIPYFYQSIKSFIGEDFFRGEAWIIGSFKQGWIMSSFDLRHHYLRFLLLKNCNRLSSTVLRLYGLCPKYILSLIFHNMRLRIPMVFKWERFLKTIRMLWKISVPHYFSQCDEWYKRSCKRPPRRQVCRATT